MKKLLVLLAALGVARLVARRPRRDDDVWQNASRALDLR
jgi:hypothetical protein